MFTVAHGFRNLFLGVAAVIAVGMVVDSNTDPNAAAAPHASTATYVAPVQGTVSSGWGARPGGFHFGLDIAADLGTPIRAVTAGEVIVAGPASGFGLWMQVRHDEDGTVTVYGHMNTIDRAVGAHVAAGEQIATVGERGEATGPHLHLEVWPGGQRANRIDPLPWLTGHGVHL